MIDFENKEILSQLCALMKDFGLDINDWCISGECAWVINGFSIPTRSNHIDIYVKESRLPWKVRDKMQTLPKRDSHEFELYSSFIEKSRIGLHLVPLPKPGLSEEFIDNYGETNSFEGCIIRVINPIGNLMDLEMTLKLYSFKNLGSERIERWTRYIKAIRDLSTNMKRRNIIVKTNQLLNLIDNKSSQHYS